MEKRKAFLTSFILGGLVSVVEDLRFQNLLQALMVNDDRSAYFLSFLAYGLFGFLLFLIIQTFFKKFQLDALSVALTVGITGIVVSGLVNLGEVYHWLDGLDATSVAYSVSSVVMVVMVSGVAYRLFRLHPVFSRSFALCLTWGGLVLVVASFIYAVTPSYNFRLPNKNNPELPSLLILTLDTTRASNLGCYGYNKNTSPFLDSLAEKGILFQNAYTSATWTLPAHTSLFTGQMPSVHGVTFQNFFLSKKLITLAEILAARGYETGGFIGGPFLSSVFHINKGFEYYDQKLDPHRKLRRYLLFRIAGRILGRNLWPPDGNRRADEINESLFPYLEWLQKRKPFFLFVNYFDPHDPYEPPDYCLKLLNTPKISMKGDLNLYPLNKKTGIACHPNGVPLSPGEFQQLRDLYDGEIRFMDDQIARLWKQLETFGLLNNTIVIIAADHGESIGEHQFLDHGHTLYQEQVHIPMIVLGPGELSGGKAIDSPTEIVDIFPTILELLKIQLPENIQGMSFLSLLDRKNVQRSDRPVWAELNEDSRPYFAAFRRRLRMVLLKERKYVEASNGESQLFDLSTDQKELRNLVDAEPHIAEAESKGSMIFSSHWRYCATQDQVNSIKKPAKD